MDNPRKALPVEHPDTWKNHSFNKHDKLIFKISVKQKYFSGIMFLVWTLQKPNFMMDAEENLHVSVCARHYFAYWRASMWHPACRIVMC